MGELIDKPPKPASDAAKGVADATKAASKRAGKAVDPEKSATRAVKDAAKGKP
jgi:hypothetical protein